MIARTLRVEVGVDRLDDVLEAYRHDVRPIHERAQGLTQHYVLVDRQRGELAFVGIWASEASLRAVADELEPARSRLWSRFDHEPTLAVYEVEDALR